MNPVEIVGRTKEDAVEKALKKLGLTIDQVEVEVLAQVKPFLGFIGKPECKVKVTPKKGVKKEESLESFETADFFKSSVTEEKKLEKPKFQKKEIKREPAKVEKVKENSTPETKTETKIEEKVDKVDAKVETKIELKVETKEETQEEIKIESIYLEEEVKRIDLSSIYKKEEVKPAREDRPVKKAVLTPEIKERIESFLTNIFAATAIEATYEISIKDDTIKIDVKGEDAARLIGRRGDSLDSLQLLIGLATNKGEEEYTRVIIDIEDYRQKREESIVRYANKMARQAAKQKRIVKLDVMNPYERRIVHSTLQDDKFVTTSSEGKEPYRRVVISPKTRRDYNNNK